MPPDALQTATTTPMTKAVSEPAAERLTADWTAWAPEHDEVYTRPERQGDMLVVRDRITGWIAGKHVLEVAAGTGWRTTVLADTAA